MRTPFLLFLATAALAGIPGGAATAQRSYLDAAMEPCSKGQASYYLVPSGTDAEGGFLATMHTMDDVLRAQGRYADQALHVPDGHFVFYYPDGKVESEGNYVKGRKDGVWQRYDKWGRELAEKVYDSTPLINLVYTMAQTMPQFPGGEKAMVHYVRDHVGKTKGDVMASFIVEKDGQLSALHVTGADDPELAERIASAISSAPRWEAGMQDGQPVRVQMRVPLK